MLLSGKNIRKSAILSLLALILLSGSGLNQFLIKNIQGVESAEELIESETEIEATFETKRNVERKIKGEGFASQPYLANFLAPSSISYNHSLAPISKVILHRSLLI
jgi:hypothetical protein